MGGGLLGRVHDDARLRARHVGLQEELHAHRGRQRGRRRPHAHASQQVSKQGPISSVCTVALQHYPLKCSTFLFNGTDKFVLKCTATILFTYLLVSVMRKFTAVGQR